ncbi:MAG: O-antigen ligase family protein, partial [Spirochaetes bacterium]|nr:O-antigen ligase family protein [Spirochaetota bacterium]
GTIYLFLCMSATLFTFTRGIYLSTAIVSLIIFIISGSSRKMEPSKTIFSFFFAGLLLIFIFLSGYLAPFIDRAASIARSASITHQEDTMWYRAELVRDRIRLISKENPYLGLGFVHNKHGSYFGTFRGNYDESIGGPGLDSADIAWGNIIYQTGWIGFGCFSFFIISVVYYIFVVFRKRLSTHHANIITNLQLIELAALLELLRLIIQTLNSAAFTGDTQNTALIFSIASFAYILQKTKREK